MRIFYRGFVHFTRETSHRGIINDLNPFMRRELRIFQIKFHAMISEFHSALITRLSQVPMDAQYLETVESIFESIINFQVDSSWLFYEIEVILGLNNIARCTNTIAHSRNEQ